jgi:hypothetical protein
MDDGRRVQDASGAEVKAGNGQVTDHDGRINNHFIAALHQRLEGGITDWKRQHPNLKGSFIDYLRERFPKSVSLDEEGAFFEADSRLDGVKKAFYAVSGIAMAKHVGTTVQKSQSAAVQDNTRSFGGISRDVLEAIKADDARTVQEALKNGTLALNNVKGAKENTPLMWCAAMGSIACLNMLIEAGAEVNANHESLTALSLAAREGHLSCVKQLVSAAADVNTPNVGGSSPLYMAAWQGHAQIARCLLISGADCNAGAPAFRAARQGHLAVSYSADSGQFSAPATHLISCLGAPYPAWGGGRSRFGRASSRRVNAPLCVQVAALGSCYSLVLHAFDTLAGLASM